MLTEPLTAIHTYNYFSNSKKFNSLTMEDKPLFQVKSGLDPFDVYGDESVIVDEENDNASVIQSTRAKLAALRAKDKVNDDIFKEADRDLEQILELEVLNKSPIPVKEPTVIITPKLTNVGSGANKDKLFQSIKETFSEIFQLMIVMLESKALFPQLPNEAEKVSKRSREFETRFNRSVFETKQQVRTYRTLKANLHSVESLSFFCYLDFM